MSTVWHGAGHEVDFHSDVDDARVDRLVVTMRSTYLTFRGVRAVARPKEVQMHTESNDAVATILWDMLGDRLPRVLLGLSDPDVHVIDGRLTMFVGGFSTTFRNRLYRAVMSVGTGLTDGRWMLDRRPLVADPRRDGWDSAGMHTPSYVPAHEGRPPRIYYAGRATTRRYGAGSAYSIGVLTLDGDGAWDRIGGQKPQMFRYRPHGRVVRRHGHRLSNQQRRGQVQGVEGPDVPLDGLGDLVGM